MTPRPPDTSRPDGERRVNLVLRALVDEMLVRLRDLSRNGASWTDDEIARAEAELESLMARVRKAALDTDS